MIIGAKWLSQLHPGKRQPFTVYSQYCTILTVIYSTSLWGIILEWTRTYFWPFVLIYPCFCTVTPVSPSDTITPDNGHDSTPTSTMPRVWVTSVVTQSTLSAPVKPRFTCIGRSRASLPRDLYCRPSCTPLTLLARVGNRRRTLLKISHFVV